MSGLIESLSKIMNMKTYTYIFNYLYIPILHSQGEIFQIFTM